MLFMTTFLKRNSLIPFLSFYLFLCRVEVSFLGDGGTILYPFPSKCSNGICNYPAIQTGFLRVLNILKLIIFF